MKNYLLKPLLMVSLVFSLTFLLTACPGPDGTVDDGTTQEQTLEEDAATEDSE